MFLEHPTFDNGIPKWNELLGWPSPHWGDSSHLQYPWNFRGGRAPRRASHGDVSAPCHPPPRAARCSPRLESACLGGHDGGASPRSAATRAGGVAEPRGRRRCLGALGQPIVRLLAILWRSRRWS